MLAQVCGRKDGKDGESQSPGGIFPEVTPWKTDLIKTQPDYQGMYNFSEAEGERHSREILGIPDEEGGNPERNIPAVAAG